MLTQATLPMLREQHNTGIKLGVCVVKRLNQSLRRHIRIHATPFVLPSCDFGFKLILRDSHVTAVIAEYISNGSFC